MIFNCVHLLAIFFETESETFKIAYDIIALKRLFKYETFKINLIFTAQFVSNSSKEAWNFVTTKIVWNMALDLNPSFCQSLMTHTIWHLLLVKYYRYFNVLSRSVQFILLKGYWCWSSNMISIFLQLFLKKAWQCKITQQCCFLLQQNWPLGNPTLFIQKLQ